MKFRFLLVWPTVVALVLTSGQAFAAAQTLDHQKCTNAMNLDWAKASKQVSKQAEGCLRNFAKGKALNKDDASIDTLEECLADDPKGRIAKKNEKTQADFDKRCAGDVPEYGVTDPNTINSAASDKEIALVDDLFGADLDGSLIQHGDGSFSSAKEARNAATCQQKVLKAAFKCQATKQNEFKKCKKLGLKDESISDVSGIKACYEGADPAKIAKQCTDPGAGIAKAVQKKCVDKNLEAPLADLFPACGTNDPDVLAACVDRAVECRFCLSANQADGASRDCDLFDDAQSNQSCGFEADSCDGLNAEECLLPFPSTFFLEPAATPTGFSVNYPDAGMPTTNPPLDADLFNGLDGANNMVQIMMHFPQGVDPELSDAARLLPAGCCGQPAGPPWFETRTYTDRSLHADSPSVLIKASTGERVLHWIEPDARSVGNPQRQVLFLRPGIALDPGTRYIVAMRELRDPSDAPVVAEPVFAALRDQTETTNPNVTKRRPYFESNIFPQLAAEGIARNDLVLAFDFITQSEHQLTHQMISMRDQVLAYVDGIEAQPGVTNFTVDEVNALSDCDPGDVLWRHIVGTFETPLFLSEVPTLNAGNVPQHTVDANDTPVQNGTMDAEFDITIPCSVFDGGVTSRPIVLGHGIFGEGSGMVLGVPLGVAATTPWTYIAGATKWLGLSDGGPGQVWVGNNIVGFGSSHLNDFPAFPDRLRQGMANTLALARMMKLGLFNRDTAFEISAGVGAFPGAGEEMYYHGISLGGIMGTFFAALTPDVERFSLDVPSTNFACLLQRSTQFSLFEALLPPIGLSDPMDQAIGVGGLIHELWASAEPGGFANRITSNPFPGSGDPSKLLYTVGWLDKQVSNQCTEVAARTLGLSNQESVLQGIVGIPDAAGPVDNGMTIYDTGYFDLFDPLHIPNIPELGNQIPTNTCDPHNGPRLTPAARLQLVTFLQPGGQVESFCTDGACDAIDAIETPSVACDPSVAP